MLINWGYQLKEHLPCSIPHYLQGFQTPRVDVFRSTKHISLTPKETVPSGYIPYADGFDTCTMSFKHATRRRLNDTPSPPPPTPTRKSPCHTGHCHMSVVQKIHFSIETVTQNEQHILSPTSIISIRLGTSVPQR